jgi:ElaB/YqjD/DUF883 family membrane-anchored ribosome-binding protein
MPFFTTNAADSAVTAKQRRAIQVLGAAAAIVLIAGLFVHDQTLRGVGVGLAIGWVAGTFFLSKKRTA